MDKSIYLRRRTGVKGPPEYKGPGVAFNGWEEAAEDAEQNYHVVAISLSDIPS